MVKQIQLTEEYYDYYDDEDDDEDKIFIAPLRFEYDEQLVLIVLLTLLQQEYIRMQSMTPEEILDEIDDMMASFEPKLQSVAYTQASNHIKEYFDSLLNDFTIPVDGGYVSMDTTKLDLMRQSLTNMVNQLRDELRVKTKFFKDNLSKDNFNILPNFKRAVRKLCDAVGNNLIYGKEKSKRNVYDFVYGEDKLYKWLTANDSKVCEWCIIQEGLPPRTIDELPLDHPWGHCVIEPIDYTYSDEYYIMLARAERSSEIELFSENKWEY